MFSTRLKKNKQERTLIFLHVPKTAGRTLHWIIERQYAPTGVFTNSRVNKAKLRARGILPRTVPDEERWQIAKEELASLEPVQRRKIKALIGHMSFGWHEFLSQPCTYIPLLRNPVDQVVSHYYYVLGIDGHYLRDEILTRHMSAGDYVCSGMSLMVNNAHTRLISGVGHKVGFGQCTIEMLETARNNLRQHFSIVGLTEEFDTTLILLRRMFGWCFPYYVRRNVNKNRLPKERISSKDMSIIKRYNELDIQLYNYAGDLYRELLSRQDASFAAELRAFKLLNSLYGLGHSSACKIKRLSRRIIQPRQTPRF